MMRIEEEALRCLLCEDAPCSKVCGSGDPARAVRAVRFLNPQLGKSLFEACSDADLDKAEKACIHFDRPIRLREMADSLRSLPREEISGAPSLETEFCGLKCENPFFLASSAICTGYDMVARAFRAGWAGVFYKTITIEDIHEVSPRFDSVQSGARAGEFIGFRNMEQLSENPADVDFDILSRLKRDFPSKIVIASIMGRDEEEWRILAQKAEKAGVDALELNFSCPQMRVSGLGSDIGQNPELIAIYTSIVKKYVSIPVIPKMTPNVMHLGLPAMAAIIAGADGISAINTIKSVTMRHSAEVSGKRIVSGYSGRAVKPIALRCILEIVSVPSVPKGFPVSGIGGIETWRDALDFIHLGCSNVQVCTAVMQYGYRIIDDLIFGLRHYMAQHGIKTVKELIGSELPNFTRANDLDRETVVYPIIDKAACNGCGRCYISCRDGGHQAITFGPDRIPHINGARCVGCHLCRLVCPVKAISSSRRVRKKS